MISERWNTQTVAVYDYTVRKQMPKDTKPQTKNGVTPISPSQASVFPVAKVLKITKAPSKSTLTRRIGRVSRVSAYISEKTPLNVSSVVPPLPGSAMFGDHSLDRFMTVLSL